MGGKAEEETTIIISNAKTSTIQNAHLGLDAGVMKFKIMESMYMQPHKLYKSYSNFLIIVIFFFNRQ